MHIRAVFVEPGYSSNVGSLCRVMKNFGFSELFIINPKCATDVDAYKGAKHAKDVLENAKKVKTFDEATEGCDFVIGTTGIKVRNKGTIRGVLPLREFTKRINYYKNKKIALVFGREGTGLSEDEINKCDLLVSVESSPAYPVLNISHAAAVILHSISHFEGAQGEKPPTNGEFAALNKVFFSLSSKFERKNMRAPVAFRRLLSRAQINEHECKALLNLFRLMDEQLEIKTQKPTN